ncbi:hypothetical protein [Chryseobacterium indoltheticum]|uniref:hypothetical protein n=1 Tax=Chryseobacterium indoltheticum TaxID=254 RepID=UPI002939171D|nr:hypothetical protein [Chryseobacterium indoltheticum]
MQKQSALPLNNGILKLKAASIQKIPKSGPIMKAELLQKRITLYSQFVEEN